jgi:hypothetical protein
VYSTNVTLFIIIDALMMEATESPLDVLSRAATMVQGSSPPEYGELFNNLFIM